MRIMAQQLGGKCLSREYVSSVSPLKWMCEKGHTWDASYYNLSQGRWCLQCASLEYRKERLEVFKKLAAERGGMCISKTYQDTKTPLEFKCEKGHRWNTGPGNILHGSWCPKCAGKAKPTMKELHALAASRNGQLLSKTYVNNRSPLQLAM
jgi:hypothetical protein